MAYRIRLNVEERRVLAKILWIAKLSNPAWINLRDKISQALDDTDEYIIITDENSREK